MQTAEQSRKESLKVREESPRQEEKDQQKIESSRARLYLNMSEKLAAHHSMRSRGGDDQ